MGLGKGQSEERHLIKMRFSNAAPGRLSRDSQLISSSAIHLLWLQQAHSSLWQGPLLLFSWLILLDHKAAFSSLRHYPIEWACLSSKTRIHVKPLQRVAEKAPNARDHRAPGCSHMCTHSTRAHHGEEGANLLLFCTVTWQNSLHQH